MGLLFLWLVRFGGPFSGLQTVATSLIESMGLLFIPAGTSLLAMAVVLSQDWLPIATSIVVSTAITIVLTGLIASLSSASGSEG
jgi:holin-like protein